MDSDYVTIINTVFASGHVQKQEKFIFDNADIAACSKRGIWREVWNKGCHRMDINFFPHPQYVLVNPRTGKSCRSFFPYIGLRPNLNRKDPTQLYDFRKDAFVNGDKIKNMVNLKDFMPKNYGQVQQHDLFEMDSKPEEKLTPKSKDVVKPEWPVSPVVVDDTPVTPAFNIKSASADLGSIIEFYQCTVPEAVAILKKLQAPK